jgi:hypothetical protein
MKGSARSMRPFMKISDWCEGVEFVHEWSRMNTNKRNQRIGIDQDKPTRRCYPREPLA